jgi:uncharacterized protein
MIHKTKIVLFSSLIGLAVIVIIINFISTELFSFRYWNPVKRVNVNKVTVKAETVSSKAKIEQGLAGRTKLASDAGMLFMMPADNYQHFWMKGMKIPIDIIWIEKNKVIGCERNIQPDDARIFSSPGFSSMVLEVNKGFCDQNDIKLNDEVKVQ